MLQDIFRSWDIIVVRIRIKISISVLVRIRMQPENNACDLYLSALPVH